MVFVIFLRIWLGARCVNLIDLEQLILPKKEAFLAWADVDTAETWPSWVCLSTHTDSSPSPGHEYLSAHLFGGRRGGVIAFAVVEDPTALRCWFGIAGL